MLYKGVLLMKKIKVIPFKYKLILTISIWIFSALFLIATNIYINTNHSMQKQYSSRKLLFGVINIPESYNLYSNYSKSDSYFLVTIVLFLVISIILGIMMVLYISSPIKKMMIAIEEVSNGNYDYKIDINSSDEFNMLGKSINSLSRNIKNLMHEKIIKEKELKYKNNEICIQKGVINSQYEKMNMLNERLEELFNQHKNVCFSTVNALINSLEVKDTYTRGHCERVKNYVVKIGKMLNFSENEILDLKYAALLHDIGKIGIPSTIINKECELTNEETELIKMHPRLGYEIVKNLSFLDKAKDAILHHHERIDGKGYPDGLTDDEISLYSRILAVADAFDAMTTGRTYRIIPFTKQVALEQLINNKNIQFDPKIVDVFVEIIKKEIDKEIQE